MVRAARHWLADLMGPADPDLVDRALLCASELVTNAIEHAVPPAGMRVEVDDRHVRIEVDDSSDVVPREGSPDATSVRGRGLMIVHRCSDSWGIDPHPGGKTVWCELLVDLREPQRGPMASTPPR
jgi:anti-sigma regulatory factor (Ser/Thr protein kinase)